MRRADSEFNRPVYAVSHATTTNQYVHARRRASKVCPNSATSRQCEEQDSNLHVLRTLEPKRTKEPLLSRNLLGKMPQQTSREVVKRRIRDKVSQMQATW